MKTNFVIRLQTDRISITRCDRKSNRLELRCEPSELFKTITAGLGQLDYNHQPVALLLDRDFVLTACCTPPEKATLEAVRYDLEETVPLDAEQMCVGLEQGSGQRLVCITSRVHLSICQNLIDDNVNLQLVAPTAVLASQEFVELNRVQKDASLIWLENETAEIISVRKGRLIDWVSVNGADSIKQQFSLRNTLAGERILITYQSNADQEVAEIRGAKYRQAKGELNDCAIRRADRIFSGTRRSRFDLLSQGVESAAASSRQTQPMTLLLAAVAIFVFSIGFVFQLAGYQYETESNKIQAQMEASYDGIFSDKKSKAERRRYGINDALKRKIEHLESVRDYSSSLDRSALVRENFYYFVRALHTVQGSDGKRFRVTGFRVFVDKIESEFQFANDKGVDWLVSQMIEWDIETSVDRDGKSTLIFRRKKMQQTSARDMDVSQRNGASS